MKTKLFLTSSLIFLCSMLSGQGTLPPWLIEWAPGPGYVLYSGPGGAYDDALLSTLMGTGGNASPCKDTITQTGHGFSLGDLIGQLSGDYFAANTNAADSLPVAFVCSVIDANTFTIGTEGWVDWVHGRFSNTDYFLQDDGSLATSADPNYTVFAFRTFGANKAAFDIPELVVDGSSGGGSGGTVGASNGLNDFDPGPDSDIELGGDMERNTFLNGNRYDINWDSFLNFYIRNIQGELLFETDTLGDRQAYLIIDVANSDLVNINYATDTKARILVNQNGAVTLVSSDVDGSNPKSFTVTKNHISATGIPEYASDAAADGDLGLPAGGLYTVTGDRSIRIKP